VRSERQSNAIFKKTYGEKATIFNGRVGHDLVKIKAHEELQVTISMSNWHILEDETMGSSNAYFLIPKVESYLTCTN
jgi:hypothetical protein